MIQQSSIDKDVVVPGSIVGKPHIRIQESGRDINQEALFCLDEVVVLACIVEDVVDFSRGGLGSYFEEPNTENDSEIGTKV